MFPAHAHPMRERLGTGKVNASKLHFPLRNPKLSRKSRANKNPTHWGLLADAGAVNPGLPQGWTEMKDPITHQSYYYNADNSVATWTIPQPDMISTIKECKDNDIHTSYTSCDESTSTRSLTYFYSALCKKGKALPPTVVNLPCNITCNAGQYLPLGKPTCSPCEPGTYSIGGGEKYMNWESFPPGFSTSCKFQLEADNDQTCNGWVLNGTYIHSGELRGKRLVDSTLTMKVELIRSGSVTFEYKVDAERRWDGLYFAVDGETVMQMDSYEFKYTQFTWPLAAGLHTLQWVIGMQYNTETCSVCPKGHYSPPGSAECLKCPVNTYADKSGTASCLPCNPVGGHDSAKYSLPGAVQCKPAKPCVETDILVTYSECNNGKRTKHESYVEPKICSGGVQPKPDKEVECSPCDRGEYRQGAVCNYCPAGKYNPNPTRSGIDVCKSCPKGFVALKLRYYDQQFTPAMFKRYLERGEMQTGCANGFCAQNGWRALGSSLDTGVGNGDVADIWLSVRVVLETTGQVFFNYRLPVDLRVASHSLLMSIVCDGLEGKLRWISEREYSWMEGDANSQAAKEDRAVIDSIVVTGVQDGGAIECVACPPGFVSDEQASICAPCPPGQFAAGGGSSCAPCTAGTFTATPGSSSCRLCGHGTFSHIGAASCDVSPTNCRYTVDDETIYDLGELARVGKPMWGPVVDSNNSMNYYINICSQSHANGTCAGRGGDAARSFACQESTLFDDFNDNAFAVSRLHVLQSDQVPDCNDSLGDTMAFYTLPQRPRNGLMVSIQGGEKCWNGGTRSLNITMYCDPEAGPGFPSLIPGMPVEQKKCGYALQWRSQYACPLCTNEDMRTLPGECSVTGKRPVHMVWKEPKVCHGGLDLPEVIYEDCQAVLLDKSKVTMIIVSGVSVFGILLTGLIYLYFRNRKIYREYSVLKEQNEAEIELDRMAGFSLDEDH
ncbi:hypothetical protein GUITHDRAFT_102302 [Guillardia theta CCMP2712]|uniref:Autophagy-related protein 27 n=1 Tax=Guillardia theta (strain CCMP2712) TaxID=905079 RepID=L1JSZ9_GUITC|nr:hypothetical protein GUITHDRAFT_102302 [Guillardia theta CCMP2712]EKX51696.1 hypothetical protein GUITHDRAFT_102302 [Guillardia theta CCMP2712]|eukprot:XP_005838676.1 hypothetical protein GUITHDRAFT_102302 [Guillardia theta CCMP2712]